MPEIFITPHWLGFFISWGTSIWIIYRLFNAAGESVKENVKLGASNWLKNLNSQKLPDWSGQFSALFDKVFTSKHLSFKCFGRSSIFSISSFMMFYLILGGSARYLVISTPPWESDRKVRYVNLQIDSLNKGIGLLTKEHGVYDKAAMRKIVKDPIIKQEIVVIRQNIEVKRLELKELKNKIYKESSVDFFASNKSDIPLGKLLILFFLANLIPDYFSLLETRYLLKVIDEASHVWLKFMLLLVDLFLTFLIFWLGIWFFLRIGLSISGITIDFRDLNYGFEYFVSHNYFIIILLATSYFTSIWIWLYLLSGIAIKILNPVYWIISKSKNIFDIDNQPFNAMGFMLMIIISISYLVWGGFIIIHNLA